MISLTFTKPGHDDVYLTEDDLFEFEFERSCFSADTFELGGVQAKSVYLLIDNNTQNFSRGTFAGRRMTLEINGKYFGIYTVGNPKRRNGVIELTAYDDMVKLDCEYPSTYEFPQLFLQVYAQCLFEAGIADDISKDNFVLNALFNNGVISHEYTDYIYANSCRNLVSGMAEWNGGFAYMNDDNKLQVDVFSKEITREYNSDELMDFDYSDETVVFSRVRTSQKNKTYEMGDDSGYTLVLSNQYISYGLTDAMFETYLQFIYDYYSGFSLTPMSFTLAEPDTELKLGDRVTVYDAEENISVTGNVSKITISGNCSMTVTCGGFGSVGSRNYKNTSASQMNQTGTEAKVNNDIAARDTLTEYTVLSDASIKYNGTTYTFSAGESGEITGCTTDKGGEFASEIPGTLADISAHNAAFMAVALMSKLSGEPEPAPEPVLSSLDQCEYRFNSDSMTTSGTYILWHNQGITNKATDLEFTGASETDGGGVFIQGNWDSRGVLYYNYGIVSLTARTVYLVAKGNSISSYRMFHMSGPGQWRGTFGAGTGDNSGTWHFSEYINGPYFVSEVPYLQKTVICIRLNGDLTLSLFANGVHIGEMDDTHATTSGNIWFGCVAGEYFDKGGYTYYDFAVANMAHSNSEIIANMKILMDKYGITGG